MKVKVIRAFKDSKEQTVPYKIDEIKEFDDERANKLIKAGFVIEVFSNKQAELEKAVKALKEQLNKQNIAINEKDTKIASLQKDLDAYKELQALNEKESKSGKSK